MPWIRCPNHRAAVLAVDPAKPSPTMRPPSTQTERPTHQRPPRSSNAEASQPNTAKHRRTENPAAAAAQGDDAGPSHTDEPGAPEAVQNAQRETRFGSSNDALPTRVTNEQGHVAPSKLATAPSGTTRQVLSGNNSRRALPLVPHGLPLLISPHAAPELAGHARVHFFRRLRHLAFRGSAANSR